MAKEETYMMIFYVGIKDHKSRKYEIIDFYLSLPIMQKFRQIDNDNSIKLCNTFP